MTVALEVGQAVAGYRGRAAARLGTLAVPKGEAALLTGPSGSGKTTILLAIAGLVDLLAGRVEIGGKTVSDLGSRARDRHRGRSIGLIFQDLHLASGLTALDNMMLASFAVGEVRDQTRAHELLHRLGLGRRVQARAETLSRGEAQRVAIARAMLLRPELILADEPTASLDDEACAAVLDLLIETARETGAALVIATHDARVKARIPIIALVEPA